MAYSKKKSRQSRTAIERIYITMRHLFIRGSYKPTGKSGHTLMESLLELEPEIYGSIADPERMELDGLLYVAERLPIGIEECRFIQLIAREGLSESGHEAIIPQKRRRNCYRIDKDRMYVEMSRGRSDIYDILTHLTFLYIEAEKIKNHALGKDNKPNDNWLCIERIVQQEQEDNIVERQALVYLSNAIGRTVLETKEAVTKFGKSRGSNSLYHLVYWLGKVAIDEVLLEKEKEITFSAELRDVIGHHMYGEHWANHIKQLILEKGLEKRPLHIISANLHSILNMLYGFDALKDQGPKSIEELTQLTASSNKNMEKVRSFANKHGMYEITDIAGTNLNVQLIDMEQVNLESIPLELSSMPSSENSVLLVMDYAFGEQAYECMDELLKPFEEDGFSLEVKSISIMGKAGILKGTKGDIMIPTAHVFEGTGDNYPLPNDLSKADFENCHIDTYQGTMITVLGTSLQNKDILHHFAESTWKSIGLEMEGAHYQKAIQSASKIRNSVNEDIKVRYAYYASDNPLETGSTLSSGSLGAEGVLPTYWITLKILEKILGQD
jgi:hypothetical protein